MFASITLVDSLDPLYAVLSNESITLPADNAGTVGSYVGSGTTIQVLEGATPLTYVSSNPTAGQFTVTSVVQNPLATITLGSVTGGGTLYANVAEHSAMTVGTDAVSLTYSLQAVRLDGTHVVVVKTQSVSKSKGGLDGIAYDVKISSTNGDIFRVGQSTTTMLVAHVFLNGLEVTADIDAAQFHWTRVSAIPQASPNDDATWNLAYASGYKQISLNVDSVYARATFHCDILTP